MAKLKEQRAFITLKDSSVGVLNLKRIETSTTSGMPDVKGINRKGASFWIEMKALDEWPKRESTCPLKGAFEKGQLSFLCEWISWKGRSFVVLRVGVEYHLFRPRLDLERLTKAELLDPSVCLATGKKEVIEYLKELG